MVAITNAIVLTLASTVLGQFKPGPKDEIIGAHLGDKVLRCNSIPSGHVDDLHRGMDKYKDGVHQYTVPEGPNSCINLFIGCTDVEKYHDSTSRICNLNEEPGHTITLPRDELHDAIYGDLELIDNECMKIDNRSTSGVVTHNNGSWIIEFGSVGASCPGS